MDSMLKELFGGDDDDRKPQAQDFVSRVEQGKIDEGYSDNEAYENFQRVAKNVDPETLQRAAEQAFSRMDPGQRAQLAQMLQQQGGRTTSGAIQDDPRQMAGMVSQIQRETPGGLSALMGGGAAAAAAGGGGGIGETLGNLFGGGGGDQTQAQAQSTDQGGGFPGGTLGKVALGGIAAFALKEILSGRDEASADTGADKKRKRSV